MAGKKKYNQKKKSLLITFHGKRSPAAQSKQHRPAAATNNPRLKRASREMNCVNTGIFNLKTEVGSGRGCNSTSLLAVMVMSRDRPFLFVFYFIFFTLLVPLHFINTLHSFGGPNLETFLVANSSATLNSSLTRRMWLYDSVCPSQPLEAQHTWISRSSSEGKLLSRGRLPQMKTSALLPMLPSYLTAPNRAQKGWQP